MDTTETDMKEMWRLTGAALLFAVVCAGAALAGLRANAQPAATPAPAATVAPAATPSPAGTAAPPDEIPDDPTVAPDSRQKADNNVSFPVDI